MSTCLSKYDDDVFALTSSDWAPAAVGFVPNICILLPLGSTKLKGAVGWSRPLAPTAKRRFATIMMVGWNFVNFIVVI